MKKTDLLDPRAERAARGTPLANAVNIPCREIERRGNELPRRSQPIRVAALDGFEEAASILAEMGRVVSVERNLEFGQSVPCRLWSPNPWLEEISPELPAGLAVDLACGTGRESVYLADRRWTVVAIDHLPDALDMGRALADRYLQEPERIEWRWDDLELEDRPLGVRPDLIVTFFYLHRPVLLRAAEALAPGGSILVETFTTLNRERNGRPRREHLALKPGELPDLLKSLEVVRHSEDWRADGRHTARIWARKPDRPSK